MLPELFELGLYGYTYPSFSSLIGTYGWFESLEQEDPFIPNHVSRSISLLIEQFENSPYINALVFALILPSQEIEYVLYDLLTKRNLNDAYGVNLDAIGEILGESRDGRDDEEYRSIMKVKPIINNSHGEPETLITYLRLIFGATDIIFKEIFPAAVEMTFVSPIQVPSTIRSDLENIAPAGVRLIIKFTNVLTQVFAFSSEGGFPEVDNTSGFSETNYLVSGETIGGVFLELI